MKRPESKSAAILTIHDAPHMSLKGRKAIAAWLRMHAKYLLRYGPEYSKRFTGRFLYS